MAAPLTAAAADAEWFAKVDNHLRVTNKGLSTNKKYKPADKKELNAARHQIRMSTALCYCAVRVLAACHAVKLG